MRTPRDRRPKPEPVGVGEEAEIEAKYRLIHRLLKRYHARRDARGERGTHTHFAPEPPPAPAK